MTKSLRLGTKKRAAQQFGQPQFACFTLRYALSRLFENYCLRFLSVVEAFRIQIRSGGYPRHRSVFRLSGYFNAQSGHIVF